MGTVHGVYLKYVGLSFLSYAGYSILIGSGRGYGDVSESNGESSFSSFSFGFRDNQPLHRLLAAMILGYSAILNGSIAVLFQLRAGMSILGKRADTGHLPFWSYIFFFPFHLPTMLYTFVHTRIGTYKESPSCVDKDAGKTSKPKKLPVPVASEVLPGWWIGGRYSYELGRKWAGVVDLTVEFPELCEWERYLLIPVWDGVPPTPEQLEEAATFSVEARKSGDVLIHCAHGRGRSTTVMCAALVRARLYATWEEAFLAVKPGRPVVKLNRKMRAALRLWQDKYMNGKKAH